MTRSILGSTVGSTLKARRVGLAGYLERRVEDLSREERTAARRGDWTMARSKALERAALREAQHRSGSGMRA